MFGDGPDAGAHLLQDQIGGGVRVRSHGTEDRQALRCHVQPSGPQEVDFGFRHGVRLDLNLDSIKLTGPDRRSLYGDRPTVGPW